MGAIKIIATSLLTPSFFLINSREENGYINQRERTIMNNTIVEKLTNIDYFPLF